MSEITFSGQVFLHRPHCTQASSAKLSCGWFGLSLSAPVGQVPAQAMHSTQPSVSTVTVPNGAPAGSAISSTLLGALRCR